MHAGPLQVVVQEALVMVWWKRWHWYGVHCGTSLYDLSSPDGLASASKLIHLPYTSLKDDKQCIPRVLYIEPCFLLSSPRFVFPTGSSLYLTLFPQQFFQSRSLFI